MQVNKLPRVLVYKRTHTGDPWYEGVFGVNDCMGSVRDRRFDAVIGIGGVGVEPRSEGIAHRLTWIGLGGHKIPRKPNGYRGVMICFDHFYLWDKQGPLLKDIAPALAKFMYEGRRRLNMSAGMPAIVLKEIQFLLKLASNYPSSKGLPRHARTVRDGLLNKTKCKKFLTKRKMRKMRCHPTSCKANSC